MGAPDPYVCPWCGRFWPVPSLAADCARRHEADDTV